MKRVEVAPGLSFPAAELATEVVASLGNRGGGKSNGAAVIVEGLLRAEIPVVVLDYVGIGRRSACARTARLLLILRSPSSEVRTATSH